jgi:ABC-type xylose transport system substrate-binding protein
MKTRYAPLSQWVSGLAESIRSPRKQLKVPFVYEGGTMACILDYVSLWFVLQRGELRVAIRSCFDPQGIDSARVVTSGKNDCRFVVEGRTGQFAIHLQVLKEEREILHYKTELTPHRTVQMVVSARDAANLDLRGVFASNLTMAQGAGQAIAENKVNDKIMLVGFDSDDKTVKLLADGNIKAIVVQDPFRMGYEGIKTALAASKGEKVPETVDTGANLITKENMNSERSKELLTPDVKK